MALPKRVHSWRSAKYRVRFRAAENEAVAIRRILVAYENQIALHSPGLLEDALKLADILEKSSKYGQKCDADDAMVLSELVELISHDLTEKLHLILAS